MCVVQFLRMTCEVYLLCTVDRVHGLRDFLTKKLRNAWMCLLMFGTGFLKI